MYVFFGLFLTICILCYLLTFFRRKRIIRKICQMDECEKINFLNHLLEPFGFSYFSEQDIITSTLDAWQREYGYTALFDQTAHHFNMIFDSEPVYFNYQNRTWLIEFWKGQYGINIGGEIGIYYADTVLEPAQYDKSLFHSIPDDKILSLRMELFYKEARLFSIRRFHWWLTGFCMGTYCEPEDLTMHISISFPDSRMLQSFTDSLLQAGYRKRDLCICGLTVAFTFASPHTDQPRQSARLSVLFSQWKNRLFCQLYLFVTRPFSCTSDKLLYLYYFLPVSFRHMLLFRRNRRQKFSRKHR